MNIHINSESDNGYKMKWNIDHTYTRDTHVSLTFITQFSKYE